MGILEDIKKTCNPQTEGFVWVNMLIRFTLDGKAEVIRSFSKPAKDSYIKKFVKPKEKKETIAIEPVKEEKTKLF